MGSAAEICEAAVAVERDGLAGLGKALDEMNLHELAMLAVLLEALFARFGNALEGLVAFDHLGHAPLDGREIGFSEGNLAIHVVEEAVVRRRTVAEFGFRKEFQDGSRHDVGSRVPHHAQSGRIGFLQQFKRHVLGEGGAQNPPSVPRSRFRARTFPLRSARPLASSSAVSLVFSLVCSVRNGRTRATTTAAASRGEMLLATSSGVVPGATSRTEPSGS